MNKFELRSIRRVIEQYNDLPDKAKQSVLDQIKYEGILRAAEDVAKTETIYFGDLYADVVEMQKYFNTFEGRRCGLKYFDDALMGLRPGELIIIAGPSNFGKTMVGLNLIVGAIVNIQTKALVISMEMPARQIASRAYNMTRNHNALMENLIIQTQLKVNSDHIRIMIERHRPDIVLLDHIQFLANQENGSNEYERVNMAVANLKRLSIDYDLPIVAISHVAKTRSGKNGEATSADLKGTSAIEQDSDINIMINRTEDNVAGSDIVLKLTKHRTKRPSIYHKECILKLEGVELLFKGEYYLADGAIPNNFLNQAPEWST